MIAYAEEHQMRLRNYTFHTYSKEFEATRRDFHCQYPPPRKKPWLSTVRPVGDALISLRLGYRAAHWMSRHPGLFGGRTIHETKHELLLDTPEMDTELSACRTLFIHNWKCRCPQLVEKHQELIRAYFQPVQAHRAAAEKVLSGLRADADLVIGIHMRQGDYKGWKNGKFYFTSPEYAEIMHAAAACFSGRRAAFLICSDQPQDMALFSGLHAAVGPGEPASDLYSLSQCDYLIGPVSTFSQWASFYGNTPLLHLRQGQTELKPENFKVAGLQLLKM